MVQLYSMCLTSTCWENNGLIAPENVTDLLCSLERVNKVVILHNSKTTSQSFASHPLHVG